MWESMEHWRGLRAVDQALCPAGAQQAPLAEARELRRCLDEARGDEAPLHERLCRPALQPRFQELGPLSEIKDFLDRTVRDGLFVTLTGRTTCRSWMPLFGRLRNSSKEPRMPCLLISTQMSGRISGSTQLYALKMYQSICAAPVEANHRVLGTFLSLEEARRLRRGLGKLSTRNHGTSK